MQKKAFAEKFTVPTCNLDEETEKSQAYLRQDNQSPGRGTMLINVKFG